MLRTDKEEKFMGIKDQAWIQEQFSSSIEFTSSTNFTENNKNNFYKYKQDNGIHLVEETQEQFDIESLELYQTIIDTCNTCDSQCCRTHDLRFTY